MACFDSKNGIIYNFIDMGESKNETTEIVNIIRQVSLLIKRAIIKSSPGIDLCDREDIEQEVKLILWRELIKQDKQILNLNAYVWRVAYTTTCKVMGDLVKKRPVTLQPPEIEKSPESSMGNNPDNSAEIKLEKEQLRQILIDEVDTLAENRRQVVKLYLLGMTQQEIASFLNWSDAKVRNLFYRGLADLKSSMAKRQDLNSRERCIKK